MGVNRLPLRILALLCRGICLVHNAAEVKLQRKPRVVSPA